ncbi:hypothetical protein BayCH28_16745 [Mycolicibacterium sp. CH28]|uniref:Imm61 family immunity protein n=1 Tax=Mycolicibacterium sp. CH28 TaxID=2512237 RepID=UPI00107FFC62|nr:Imm61 family immunity protein [Mycolicibacterium sp. CH28]TGD86875.1 hypothetical protein BayCH28_16745 [Mycolicibacterium sp. CH28]
MTGALRINPELIDWAQRAGYALTPQDQSGAALFWSDPGGETRLLIRTSDNGATLTSADRGQAEVFVLSSPQLEVIEDYLWDFFGSDVRAKLDLPWLKVPSTIDQLAAEFTIERRADGFVYLMGRERTSLAQARNGAVGVIVACQGDGTT